MCWSEWRYGFGLCEYICALEIRVALIGVACECVGGVEVMVLGCANMYEKQEEV